MVNVEEIFKQNSPSSLVSKIEEYLSTSVVYDEYYEVFRGQDTLKQIIWDRISLLWLAKCRKDSEEENEPYAMVGNSIYKALEEEIKPLEEELYFDGKSYSPMEMEPDELPYEVSIIQGLSAMSEDNIKRFSSLIFYILERNYGMDLINKCGKDLWVLDAF